MIVAIDGVAGSGKTTLAANIAKEFGFNHVNGGAFYRTIAYQFDKMGFNVVNVKNLKRVLKNCDIRVNFIKHKQQVVLNDKNITNKIHTAKYSVLASKVSPFKCVRKFITKLQRKLAKENSCVFEGRDVGSVVFPKAEVKLFLTASVEIRAKRRFKEYQQKGDNKLTYKEILKLIIERDKADATRELSPLVCPKDAFVIDTGDKTIEEVLALAIKKVREKIK